MRKKILTRLAAGTCGICFCYALAYQALSGDVTALEPEYAITESVTEPVTEALTEGAISESPIMDDNTAHHRGKRRRWDDSTEAFYGDTPSAQGDSTEETEEDKKQSENEAQEDDTGSGSATTSGDPPTLSEFLSTLRCGGCRHGCSLLNPRCMKGRSKAENATVEYQEIYGSDNT